jgi:hypothetical protein
MRAHQRGNPQPMRRQRIYGFDRRKPGSDTATPHVVQAGAVTTGTARRHLQTLSRRDLARPTSGAGGLTLLLVLLIAAVIAAMVLAATGGV